MRSARLSSLCICLDNCYCQYTLLALLLPLLLWACTNLNNWHTHTHTGSNTHPQAHTQSTYSSITRKRKERTKTKRRLQLGITCFFAALQKIQHLAVFFDCSSPLRFSFFGNSRRRFSLLPVNQMSAQQTQQGEARNERVQWSRRA